MSYKDIAPILCGEGNGNPPTMAVILCVPTEAESYGYCWGQAVDLSPVMPATQFCVTEERGTYLCTARALVFKGSILAYNSTLNEAEWVPMCGLANDLSWAEERSAVALANYVPHTPEEAERIARLRVGRVVSCPGDDSSTTSMEGEESRFSDAPSTGPHTDMDREAGKESKEPIGSEEEVNRWMSPGEGAQASPRTDQCQRSQNWESIMEESEGLPYNNPRSTIMGVDSPSVPPLSSCDESGNSPPTTSRGSVPCSPGSPMEEMPLLVPAVTTPASGVDTIEVHVLQSELDNL